MKTDMGTTGPGKAEVYTMAYVYCYIFFSISPTSPTPRGGAGQCDLHEGREFCVRLMNISYMCRTVSST